MSPDWSDLRTHLLAWAIACSGLPDGAARWTDEPARSVAGPTIELSVVSILGRGTDETVFDVDADDPGIEAVPRTGGHRELNLQLAVEGYDQRISSAHPIAVAARISTLVSSPKSLEVLERCGLGVLSVGDATTYSPRTAGGRTYPRAVVEVRLSFVSAVTGAPIPFIESVHATGIATRPDTTEITVPVAVTS